MQGRRVREAGRETGVEGCGVEGTGFRGDSDQDAGVRCLLFGLCYNRRSYGAIVSMEDDALHPLCELWSSSTFSSNSWLTLILSEPNSLLSPATKLSAPLSLSVQERRNGRRATG